MIEECSVTGFNIERWGRKRERDQPSVWTTCRRQNQSFPITWARVVKVYWWWDLGLLILDLLNQLVTRLRLHKLHYLPFKECNDIWKLYCEITVCSCLDLHPRHKLWEKTRHMKLIFFYPICTLFPLLPSVPKRDGIAGFLSHIPSLPLKLFSF